MNRRPWPIVILAVIQILSPLLGLIGQALYYKESIAVLAAEIWSNSPWLMRFETFLLPLLVGLLIYFARRWGYYIALLGSGYIIYRNLAEFIATDREAPVWMTVIANSFVLACILYLLNPKVRAIYLNPALRWWETAPRFLIAWPTKIHRPGEEKALEGKLHDISIGGAGLDGPSVVWVPDEEITLEFDCEGTPMQMRGHVVYQKGIMPGIARLGVKWSEGNSKADRSRLRRLIRTLYSGGVPVSRRLPYWWDDFKSWLPLALTSKEAWLPRRDRQD